MNNTRQPFDDPNLRAALNTIAAHCHERGIRTLRFSEPIDLSPPRRPTDWSHRPQRHDPDPATVPCSKIERDRLAIDRARRLAALWSEQNGFVPALHLAQEAWEAVHHEECQSWGQGSDLCDCDPLAILRLAGQLFAVSMEGSIEPFQSPPPTAADLNDARHAPPFFFKDLGDDVWLARLSGDEFSFVSTGSGESALLLEAWAAEPSQNQP